MAAQYELLKELLNSGTKLSFGQDFFFKFYQAFLLKDRWMPVSYTHLTLPTKLEV